MKIKNKKFAAIMMAMGIMCTAAMPAFAADTTDSAAPVSASESTSDEIVLWPEIDPLSDLYDEPNVNKNDSTFTSDPFKTISGYGDIVRVWFQNTDSDAVTVYLQQYDTSKKEYVDKMHFDVASGGNKWKELNKASVGTYRIQIYSKGGKRVTGYLRAVQTKTSLAQ